jgi:CP family cyanate transporter-like MFS transporter
VALGQIAVGHLLSAGPKELRAKELRAKELRAAASHSAAGTARSSEGTLR